MKTTLTRDYYQYSLATRAEQNYKRTCGEIRKERRVRYRKGGMANNVKLVLSSERKIKSYNEEMKPKRVYYGKQNLCLGLDVVHVKLPRMATRRDGLWHV